MKIQYKRIILLCLTVLMMGTADAQRRGRSSGTVINAYPVLGATVSQIEGDGLKGFRKWAFTAGVGATFPLDRDQLWDASIEATFSRRGAMNISPRPYRLYGMSLDYVDIPVMIHFTDPKGGLTVGAGLSYSRLVQQPHGEIFFSPQYFIPDTSDMTFLKNDLAIVGDIRFPIWENLMLDFRWQYSLFPIKRDWHFIKYEDDGTPQEVVNNCYNNSIAIRLMYIFGQDNRSKKHHHRR